jgi:hypothetical protein
VALAAEGYGAEGGYYGEVGLHGFASINAD